MVLTAPLDQLFHLLSVSRLFTILDQTNDGGVICKLQEFYGQVIGGAVISVEGAEQRGEDTPLWGASADGPGFGRDAPQSDMLLPVNQEADDPLTGGDRHFELGELLM